MSASSIIFLFPLKSVLVTSPPYPYPDPPPQKKKKKKTQNKWKLKPRQLSENYKKVKCLLYMVLQFYFKLKTITLIQTMFCFPW